MKLGLVGYPQVGKKTLFKLLTGQDAQATGLGLAAVSDERFEDLATRYDPQKRTPATIEFEMLPDLEEDAQKNAAALKSLERVDVICHLVRRFADETVYHLAGSVDPARDIRSFAEELQLADMIFIEKRLERLAREQKVQAQTQSVDAHTDLQGSVSPSFPVAFAQQEMALKEQG